MAAWVLFSFALLAALGLLATGFIRKSTIPWPPPRKRHGVVGLYLLAIATMILLLVVTTSWIGRVLIAPSPLWITAVVVFAVCITQIVRVSRPARSMTPAEHAYYYDHRDERPAQLAWPGTPIVKYPREPWADSAVVKRYRAHPRRSLILTSITAVVALAGGGLVLAAPAQAEEAEVVKIVDGDTLDVRVGDETVRVRMLNINTPELHDDDGAAECLADAARNKLRELAPVGTTVVLQYGPERFDRYGRTLAAVREQDGTLLSTQLASQGLGTAISVGRNTLTYREVDAAQSAAQAAGVGLFDPNVACTPAAVFADLEETAAIDSTLPAGSAELAALSGQLDAVTAEADSRMAAVLAAGWITDGIRADYESRLAGLLSRTEVWKAKVGTAIADAQAKEQAAAEAAVAKAAADEAARVAAEAAQAAADEAARQAAEAAAQEAAEYPSGDGAGDSGGAGSDSGGGYPSDAGYTGCRNYNGYGMVDSKGRHFEPIPC